MGPTFSLCAYRLRCAYMQKKNRWASIVAAASQLGTPSRSRDALRSGYKHGNAVRMCSDVLCRILLPFSCRATSTETLSALCSDAACLSEFSSLYPGYKHAKAVRLVLWHRLHK